MRPTCVELFAGIGGFGLAASRAGFKVARACELDGFARQVYAARFPGVPSWPDVTTFAPSWGRRKPTVLTAGFPCQDLSVAGKRAGLEGGRSGLFWEIVRIAERLDPDWLLLENVPGLLSSNGGRDLATVVGALVGADLAAPDGGWGGSGVACGPAGVAVWRILDARWFGVPQRRRRWFCLVDRRARGTRALAVLLEPAGVRRDPPTSSEAGPGAAGGATARALSRIGGQPLGGSLHMALGRDVSTTVTDRSGPPAVLRTHPDINIGDTAPTLREGGRGRGAGDSHDNTPVVFEPRVARNGRGAPSDVVPPLKAESGQTGKGDSAPVVIPLSTDAARGRDGEALTPSPDAEGRVRLRDPGLGVGDAGDPAFTVGASWPPAVFDPTQITSRENRSNPQPGGPAPTLAKGAQPPVMFKPAHYTRGKDGASEVAPPLSADADKGDEDAVAFAGVPRRLTPVECERLQGFPDGWTDVPGASDSARYRALGNAVAVPVVEWILRRLAAVT